MFITSVPSKKAGGAQAHDYKSIMGDKINYEAFVQFIPGHVEEVITDKNHPLYVRMGQNDLYLNTIKATPHHTNILSDDIFKKMSAEWYQPLLRGISDIPTKGDQVLLCNFGGINYYIGPLNTQNNDTTNVDNLYNDSAAIEINEKTMYDPNPLFPYSNTKPLTTPVESIDLMGVGSPSSGDGKKASLDITRHAVGDNLIKGRMGSSIRLGSRGNNPNVIISGGRGTKYRESPLDYSFISMTSFGRIVDNFDTTKNEKLFQSLIPSNKSPKKGSEVQRTIPWSDTLHKQIYMSSDKITIASRGVRGGNITLSSNENIMIGSRFNTLISTGGATIIESKNIYLGEKALPASEGDAPSGEPLVLGNKLVKLLEGIIEQIGKLYVGATIGGVSTPVETSGSPGWMQLLQLKNQVKEIISDFHYIEQNSTDRQPKE